ncbi:MAG: DNA adenine methylase [Muribaculaceae bacterium]|nr:DNA adenine methylase [Muribaculaceae bacterium]
MAQLSLFPEFDIELQEEKSSTFEDNMKLPIHRWYRYTAGFSAAWVAKLIEEEIRNGRTHIIDPFVGSGTVALESTMHDVEAYGLESNPYVYRIASAKLMWNHLDVSRINEISKFLISRAKEMDTSINEYPAIVRKCFPDETLTRLDALKRSSLEITDTAYRNFFWFIITSILRSTSPVGTAQWQYIQPNKSKAKVLDPFVAFENKVKEVCSDIRKCNVSKSNRDATVLPQDARGVVDIPDNWGDLVITSPPYANNYDYADAMRLEMSFWGDLEDYKGLQKISKNLVRACTQHVGGMKNDVYTMMQSPLLSPIYNELKTKFEQLHKERENHGGKKNYHLMIVAYFYDLAQVFNTLNLKTSRNCRMCFVIGDSAPYGIYIPVDEWLGKLALNSGFSNFSFEKLRDRNVKWKNRKHRVPLKEGRLWINK